MPLHHAPFDKLRVSGDGPAGAERPLRVPPQGEELVCKSVRPSRRTSRTAFTAPVPEPDDPLLAFVPYAHKQPRGNSITPVRQRAFIAALAASGIVTQAARAIGASLEALYKLRQRPGAEGFAAAWDEALRLGAERLEHCALERALAEGWEHDGSAGRGDALLIYLLQRRGSFRVDERDLVPGHPVYERLKERLRAEWEEGRLRHSGGGLSRELLQRLARRQPGRFGFGELLDQFAAALVERAHGQLLQGGFGGFGIEHRAVDGGELRLQLGHRGFGSC